MKKCIMTENAPKAIGPYSQAVSAGDFVFVSGQLPINPKTDEFPSDDVSDQTRQCLKNIQEILNCCCLNMNSVVKTTVLLKNISDFSCVNEVYKEFFEIDCPARACYEVANLPKGALVEIEAIAYKNN